jgi:hypothetical protein
LYGFSTTIAEFMIFFFLTAYYKLTAVTQDYREGVLSLTLDYIIATVIMTYTTNLSQDDKRGGYQKEFTSYWLHVYVQELGHID